jgi:ribosomal protein S18 acetylase RimI-like enzyme
MEGQSPERQDVSVTIEPASSDDLRSLVDIEETVSLEKYPNTKHRITREDVASIGFGDERAAKYRERFLENDEGNIWVARLDGEVVGFAAATKGTDRSWLRKLYVTPASQRRGVGEQLLRTALDWLGDEKEVVLGIASYDEAAKAFYSKHGFQEIGQRSEDETTIPSGKVLPETLMLRQRRPQNRF